MVTVGLRGRRGRSSLTAAAGCVGIQHFQEKVVHQNHVLLLHGRQVVHAFVAVEREGEELKKPCSLCLL